MADAARAPTGGAGGEVDQASSRAPAARPSAPRLHPAARAASGPGTSDPLGAPPSSCAASAPATKLTALHGEHAANSRPDSGSRSSPSARPAGGTHASSSRSRWLGLPPGRPRSPGPRPGGWAGLGHRRWRRLWRRRMRNSRAWGSDLESRKGKPRRGGQAGGATDPGGRRYRATPV